MAEIKEITCLDEKSKICNRILRALPNWFGAEPSIVDYTERVQAMPFFAAFTQNPDGAVGFIALKTHNKFTSEICVTGVLEEFHRQGIDRSLVAHCENY